MLTTTNQKIGDLECVVLRAADQRPLQSLLVLCHGFGAPSTDLVPIADEMLSRDPGLMGTGFVFPAAPIELDPLFGARAWWMIDVEKIQQMMMEGESRDLENHAPPELESCRSSLIKLIDLCRVDFDIAPNKIVIGGFSQGAMLTTDVALHYREPLGGLVIWSGNLINSDVWQKRSKTQTALEIVQSHGRLDPILPMDGAEKLREMLTNDGHNVQFIEFNGQHAIPREAVDMATQLVVGLNGSPTEGH